MHSGMLISPANQFSVTQISTAHINKPANSICNTYPDIPLSGLSQSVYHPSSLPVPETTWTGDLPYHQASTGHHLSPPGHSTQWCFAERARYNDLFKKKIQYKCNKQQYILLLQSSESILKNCRWIPNNHFWRHRLLGVSKEPECAQELAFIKTLFSVMNMERFYWLLTLQIGTQMVVSLLTIQYLIFRVCASWIRQHLKPCLAWASYT